MLSMVKEKKIFVFHSFFILQTVIFSYPQLCEYYTIRVWVSIDILPFLSVGIKLEQVKSINENLPFFSFILSMCHFRLIILNALIIDKSKTHRKIYRRKISHNEEINLRGQKSNDIERNKKAKKKEK